MQPGHGSETAPGDPHAHPDLSVDAAIWIALLPEPAVTPLGAGLLCNCGAACRPSGKDEGVQFDDG
jgi:hypothetical protein